MSLFEDAVSVLFVPSSICICLFRRLLLSRGDDAGTKVHSIAPLRLLTHCAEILQPLCPSSVFHSMLSICIGAPLPRTDSRTDEGYDVPRSSDGWALVKEDLFSQKNAVYQASPNPKLYFQYEILLASSLELGVCAGSYLLIANVKLGGGE